jgi:16S rRNA processing protein RimM
VTEPSPADRARLGSTEVVAVGRIGKPHGIRGEVYVEPWTDAAEERFVLGAELATDPPQHGPLTVEGVRQQSGKLVLRFAGLEDRNAVEAIRGAYLVLPVTARPPIEDPDEFYDTDLIGLTVQTLAGEPVGPIVDVLHSTADSLLVIDLGEREVLLPFRKEMVPVVDLERGIAQIDPPDGIFDL